MDEPQMNFKLFFVVHDHSGARTYANQFLACLRSCPEVKVTKGFYESRFHSEFFADTSLSEIHLPPVKNKVDGWTY